MLVRDPRADGIDQRLATLAAAVRVDRCFESSWELLRYGLFKDLTYEVSGRSSALGAVASASKRSSRFGRVRDLDVVFVTLRRESKLRRSAGAAILPLSKSSLATPRAFNGESLTRAYSRPLQTSDQRKLHTSAFRTTPGATCPVS